MRWMRWMRQSRRKICISGESRELPELQRESKCSTSTSSVSTTHHATCVCMLVHHQSPSFCLCLFHYSRLAARFGEAVSFRVPSEISVRPFLIYFLSRKLVGSTRSFVQQVAVGLVPPVGCDRIQLRQEAFFSHAFPPCNRDDFDVEISVRSI